MRGTGEPTGGQGRMTYRIMDVIVAAILMAVGAVVMVGSYELGAGWSSTGPEFRLLPLLRRRSDPALEHDHSAGYLVQQEP